MALVNAKPAFVSPAENNAITINELIAELINLDNAGQGFEISAELMANTVKEVFAELTNLAGMKASSSDAFSAKTMKKTIQELVSELISLKRDEVGAEPNTEAKIRDIAKTIDTIIADFIENNKTEIEVQSIKGMTDAELVSFTKSVRLLLFHSALYGKENTQGKWL